ncbi:MAG: hypothetical protein WAN86_22700, partial [Hyphomicrobiaceae bacterium]
PNGFDRYPGQLAPGLGSFLEPSGAAIILPRTGQLRHQVEPSYRRGVPALWRLIAVIASLAAAYVASPVLAPLALSLDDRMIGRLLPGLPSCAG